MQNVPYVHTMGRLISINLRLSAAHIRMLARISEKTGLNRTNAIRLAITRLADEENVRKASPLNDKKA